MIVKVSVKPGSKKGPLVVENESGLIVFLREKPHDGVANEALARLLAGHFGVAKSLVEIKRGGKSREKVVEIFGLPKKEKM